MMNIILVSDSLAKSRIVTISQSQIILAAMGFVSAGFMFALGTYWVTMKYAVDIQNPFIQSLISTLTQQSAQQAEKDMREQLNSLAMKLGELQARMMRLDAFGERLAKVAGVDGEFNFSEPPGVGGPSPNASMMGNVSYQDFRSKLTDVSKVLDDRADKFGMLDSVLMQGRLAAKAIPTTLPVTTGYFSSNFGYRIDPFNGRSAFHTGVDFIAAPGSPILAAAGGVVSASEWHNEYGNMVDIDHDNGLTTRYAHLSQKSVVVGDVVLKGQIIGSLGQTGRATGPHLHFEVRENSVPLNPNRFLNFSRAQEPAQAVKSARAP
ncbi:MAG TPA: peptidase M23 [Betaproteobacteria bacterium]|jgi:murein DD-endopeptidase MepM/ murein hydrolase activator NlpD|nr:peptidase M23 [Betaproteobacteria bacterium]